MKEKENSDEVIFLCLLLLGLGFAYKHFTQLVPQTTSVTPDQGVSVTPAPTPDSVERDYCSCG